MTSMSLACMMSLKLRLQCCSMAVVKPDAARLCRMPAWKRVPKMPPAMKRDRACV